MEYLKADVVVLGTGGAGLAAAITVAEGGARVRVTLRGGVAMIRKLVAGAREM